MTDRIRRRVRISGRVQGVFFRGSTEREAMRHGVAGFVRNLPGGDLEAAFEGPPQAVETLLAFVRRGPPHAEVREVQVEEEPPQGEATFRVRY